MPEPLTVIETFAGSAGAGPATAVAQTPNALGVAGRTLYVSDGLWSVIRAIDLPTGDERVVASELANPVDVTADGAGNVLVVDYANHRILRLDPAGTLTTVTGTGQPGFGGDGGPAVHGQLDTPNGVSVDRSGNLYVADTNNQRVRRVDAAGTITTVAGTGEAGHAGDGGPATQARLSAPSGVHAAGDGSVYIADSDNHCIRRVDPRGVIHTIAGTGTAGFGGDGGPATEAQLNTPFSVFADAAGAVYVPDFGNERVRRVDPSGVIATIAGTGVPGFGGDGGPAVEAQLRSATDVAEDADGNLYVSDLGNRRVRRISPDGRIATVAGNGSAGHSGDGGPATRAQLLLPADVCLDGGATYVADTRNHRIRRIDAAGVIATVAGTGRAGAGGDGEAATAAQLNRPTGLSPDGAGGLYVADRGNHRIRRVTADGRIATVAGTGTPDDGPDRAPALAAALNAPAAVVAGPVGEVWIADTLNHRVRRLGPDGTLVRVAGVGTPGYCGDGGVAWHAHLNTPTGLALGTAGEVFVADTLNHRVRRIDASGRIETFAGTGEPGADGDGGPARDARLSFPTGLALDAAGGLLIADNLNRRVRRVDAAGTIETIAGDGTPGLAGDGGPPAEARLRLADTPGELSGLAVAATGEVYVADTANHRVRRLAGAPARPRHTDVIAAAGAPEAAGEPALVGGSAGGVRMVYRGRDGHIHELRAH